MITEYDADVIVVGSVSRGSLTAQELARAGRNVIVLEAGPETPDRKITENYRTRPHDPYQ
jgi:choline dehydrogenase-like flavoprotein